MWCRSRAPEGIADEVEEEGNIGDGDFVEEVCGIGEGRHVVVYVAVGDFRCGAAYEDLFDLDEGEAGRVCGESEERNDIASDVALRPGAEWVHLVGT